MPIPQSIEMSYLEAMINDTLADHGQILLARAYHEGIQPVYLTDRQREYLGIHADDPFSLNVTRTVVTCLADELNIVGFDTSEKPDKEGIKKQAGWFWDLWNKNKMDAHQSDMHEITLRDREAFIVLDWDKESGYTTINIHERYTDIDSEAYSDLPIEVSDEVKTALTGTGQGVWAIYENDDPSQPMKAACQQWYDISYDEDGKLVSIPRRTIYYVDRIERFEYVDNDWKELEGSPQEWKGKDGKPLGIPVIHFKNKGLRPEAWDAININDAINKTWVDILGSMDLAGFPMFVLLGMYPTTDGKAPAEDGTNNWSVGPGQFLGNANISPNGASIERFEGSDPTPLMNTLEKQIIFLAEITSTPASRFIITAAVASDATQKEQEKPLRKKAYNRQILFGDSWEQVMKMARRISNAFGGAGLDEEITIETIWKNIESTEELQEEKDLGIPNDLLWPKLGYTQKQIEATKNSPEYKVQFMKAFWEAYKVAAPYQTIEAFAKQVGLNDDDITVILGGQKTEETPPAGDGEEDESSLIPVGAEAVV